MNKSKQLYSILVYIYLFLFVFSMVNREFVPFGIDLRMIELPLGILIIIMKLVANKLKIRIDKQDKIGNLLIIFYCFTIVSIIAWIWNGLEFNQKEILNEIILIINILVSIIIVYNNKNLFNEERINLFVIISCIVLSLSMILVHQGVPFKTIMGSDNALYMYKGNELVPHINLYGENYRVAGYASDPNYATMLLLIGVICTLKSKRLNKLLKTVLIMYFIVCIGLCFSKTIVIASVFWAIYVALTRKMKIKNSTLKMINKIFICTIIIIVFIIPFIIDYLDFMPTTLTTRFAMWRSASELFLKSPIIGGGLTSFRSYFSINNWYVQAHSTYWQILSELGIVGIILYAKLIIKILNENIDNKYNYFLILVFATWIITCETIAIQFSIFILYFLNIHNKKKMKNNRALFFVNSISKGGAERVCINLANELLEEGYGVDFIVLDNNEENNKKYKIDDRIEVFNLNIDHKSKVKKIYKILLSIYQTNKLINKKEDNGEYNLITSHLPMSNILTRFSSVGHRAIYVFHTTMRFYDKNNSAVFKNILKIILKNRKIVCVSKGLENECKENYNMKYSEFSTIYNPINIDEIYNKMNEEINFEEPYILQVGRFCEAKRQDRMLEIFYKGKFYEKYKLVFCGAGDLEKEIEEKTKKLKIEDKVIFLGWQENIYKWMSNCKILVSTSDIEAFPMTLIEAIVCKAKIVSSNCKFGPNEILTKEYEEFLVEPDKINQYIEKINKALEKYPNSKNDIIEKCKAQNVVKEYIQFYNK